LNVKTLFRRLRGSGKSGSDGQPEPMPAREPEPDPTPAPSLLNVESEPGAGATEPDASAEREWVRSHTVEAPSILREFLGGDGLSLEGKSVLDLGCGDGLLDWGIATSQHPARLVGVDLELTDSEELRRRLRDQGLAPDGLPGNLSFATCTPDRLPFSDDEFDWALSWSVFEHIHDPAATIREIRRVLKPSGCFFVQLYPFFWSEHGPHLEQWYPEGFAQRFDIEQIMTRVSPTFARERTLRVGEVQHARHGNRQPGDAMMWEYLNLNRMSLDDLHRALLLGGFWVTKAQLISNAIHLPMELNVRSLTELLVAGVYMTAVPSPLHITLPRPPEGNTAEAG
jgi:ubiquinone/menaquinone biosynthesis C-methylase UbiE